MTGIILHPLASAAVGAACAAAGVYAVPADPERAETDRALLRTGVATAAACAWALWRDELAVTLVPFVATTLLLGELRLRALRREGGDRPARPVRAPVPARVWLGAGVETAWARRAPAETAAPLPDQASSPSSSPSRGSSR